MSTAVWNVDGRARSGGRDTLSRAHTLWATLAAGVFAAIFSLAAWLVLERTSLPAFNTSMVTRALATAGTLMVLVAVGVLAVWWLQDKSPRPRWRRILTYLVFYIAPAALVVTTIAIPLSSTRLYLDGIQVDQAFRTQFLTRMETTMANQDMNYLDMPTYYPIGWFWLGGRLANVLGIPGWEVYQPWAIVSLAIAASILVPLWQRVTGSLPVAAGIALVTTAVTLVLSVEEPYAGIIAMGVPLVCVILHTALGGSWFATAAVMLFFSVSASFYTLFTGVVALAVVVLAVVFAATHRQWWVPFTRMLVIGFGSIAIAALAWGPYFYRLLTGDEQPESTANHYLPAEGTQVPVPFLAPSVIGLLCLIGLFYLVLRFRDRAVRMLTIATVVFYAWALASMVATLAGSTLLGFRIEILIVLMMATAGVLALAEIGRVGPARLYPESTHPHVARRITTIGMIVLLGGGLFYAQAIPARNESAIDNAYSDTDGYGERADQYVADVGSAYVDIRDTITGYGHEPTETVVLTDETPFLSYYPFHGFNAFTSHYANPLGEFSQRNEEIARWAEQSWSSASDPEAMHELITSSRWEAPDVFLFRGSDAENLDDGWKLHLAEDIYPNQPNVRYEATFFNPAAFDDPDLWHIDQVGAFVVVTATH